MEYLAEIRDHLTWPKMVGSITRLPKWAFPMPLTHTVSKHGDIHVFFVDQQNCHTSWNEF